MMKRCAHFEMLVEENIGRAMSAKEAHYATQKTRSEKRAGVESCPFEIISITC
jgi:hypothetical protein